MNNKEMPFSANLIKDRDSAPRIVFDIPAAFKTQGCESPKAKCANRCRECMLFDPAYDLCYFFGSTRIDDLACDSFQPVD